jgi:PAS domain S-box-containing protein
MPENPHTSIPGPLSLDKFLSLVIERSSETIFIMDRDGRLLDSDNVFRDELRTGTLKSAIGKKPKEFIDIETRKQKADIALSTGKPASFDSIQDDFVSQYTIYPVFSADGNIAHFLLSARKTSDTQDTAKKDYNTLDAIAELYDAIPASIIIVDAQMRLIGWNSFSRDAINGLSDNEMPGINPLKRVHPEDFTEVSRKVHNIIHLDTEESAEFRMFHKNGPPYKWAMFRGKRTIIEGQPCMVAVVTEISELKQAEEKQKKLQEELQQYQKMELIGQLAGGIAHDFNNALAAILGNTELALKKLTPSSPVVENINDIHKLARRSAEMTRQLLAFARKQVTLPKVFDMNEAVSECLQLHRRLIGEHIHFEWNPYREQLRVRLDPSQLDQILSNLFINARDAISGSGKILIGCDLAHFSQEECQTRCSGCLPGDYVRLFVSDNGSGIEAKMLPHIYEPFFTTKEIGKGTGLGLSTVYGIVMQNKGHIECYSEPGIGTTFNIFLPLYHEESEKTEAPYEPFRRQEHECSLKARETIMVVEDEPYILKLIRDILEDHAFTVMTALDAEECLRITGEHDYRIDLVVTDVLLPDMNGIEMSRLLRQQNPSIKILFMSAHAPENLSHQQQLRDGVDFIQKPFGIADFFRAIENVLQSCKEQP